MKPCELPLHAYDLQSDYPDRRYCAIIAAHDEAAADGENVLKCISTVSAQLKHTSVEPNGWIHV